MQAFSLKESWADKFEGGSLARRDGSTFDVGAALDATDTVEIDEEQVAVKKGYIVAVDDYEVALLSAYEPLKQTSLKEATRVAAKRPAGDKKESA